MRKLIGIGVILCLLSGCGFKDIDKRFFVVAIAVDKGDTQDYKVTIKLAIPSAQEKFGSNDYLLVTEESRSIAEGIRVIKSKVDKELDFGQAKAIIFGQELVQSENISQALDWFIRRRDIQKIAWLGEGVPSGRAILDLKPKTERLPSNQLFLFFGLTGTETAYVVSEYLFDFRRRLTERGLDPILPVIQKREHDQVTVNQLGLFDKNKQQLILSPLETKMFNSLYQGIGKYDIHVPYEKGYFIISADSVKGTFSFKSKNGKPYICVTMKVEGVIEESNVKVVNHELNRYEKAAEQNFQAKVEKFLVKLQKAQVDPIGFGLRYRSRHFGGEKVWEAWEKLYPEIEFKVETKVKLTGTGVLG